MKTGCFIGILLFFLIPIHLCAAENNPEQRRRQLETKAHETIRAFLQDIFDYSNKDRMPDEIISGLVAAVANDFFDYSVGLTDAKLNALIGYYGDQKVCTFSKRLYEESKRIVNDLDKWQEEQISVSVSARGKPFLKSLQTNAEKMLKDRPELKDKLAQKLYSYALREHPAAANLCIEFHLTHGDIDSALLGILQRFEDRMKSPEQQTKVFSIHRTKTAGDTHGQENDWDDLLKLLDQVSDEIESLLEQLERSQSH